MIIIESSKSIFVDVDDTLLIWSYDDDEESDAIDICVRGSIIQRAVPNEYNIKFVKEFKARGHTIIVWSAGGWEWAKYAIKILKLEDVVDVVMSKPDWYIDDKPAEYFMGQPTYFDRRTGKKLTGNKRDIEI